MKKITLYLFALLLTACSIGSQKNASGFVTIQGHDLVKPNGEKLFIQGTNLGNWLNPESPHIRGTANLPRKSLKKFCAELFRFQKPTKKTSRNSESGRGTAPETLPATEKSNHFSGISKKCAHSDRMCASPGAKTPRVQMIAFDPTAKGEVDTTLSAEERSIGGLGIHIVRQIMDSINYKREGDRNVLTLVKKL